MVEKQTDEILVKMIDTKIQLNWKIENEEVLWEQRVRENWINLRDRNTTFSHSFATQRRRTNMIKVLEDEHGRVMNGDGEM